MKKFAIYSLVGLLTLSCSVSSPNNSLTVKENFTELAIKYNFADLEKEYKSFHTKALSDGYVLRMFTKFLTTSPNPTQVIRQLEFARYLKDVKSDSSYYNSLKTIITNDTSIFTKINTTTGVPAKKTSESATFGVFVDSLNPFLSTPTANAATSITNTSFTANWTATGGATGYILTVLNGSTPTDYTLGNVTTYNVTGLTGNTAYSYTVKATNASGTGSSSNSVNVTTSVNLPSTPTANAATNVTPASFIANWTAAGGATGYILTVMNGSTPTNYTLGNVTSYNIIGLTGNTAYSYTVKATNASGTGSSSNSVNVTTSVNLPSTPTANAATNVTPASFTANWTAAGEATGYILTVLNGSTPTNYTLGNVTTYNVTGLTDNTAYSYTVKATNANGSGSSSNSVSVNTLLASEVFVSVQGGTFQMGDASRTDASPVHTVNISNFYIGKYEVTQAEWSAVYNAPTTTAGLKTLMGSSDPSYFPVGGNNGNLPVETVTWWNVIAFCNAKSLADGLPVAYNTTTGALLDGTGAVTTDTTQVMGYRLPTGAEWEFAARGGNSSLGYTYSGSNTVGNVAWYSVNAQDVGLGHADYGTHHVGTKAPNELGLYDMNGNVWEWTSDWYVEPYSSSTVTNPYISSGTGFEFRGGGWTTALPYNYRRLTQTTSYSGNPGGFRISRSATVPDGFKLVTKATFTMGDQYGDGYSNELPTHSVTFTKDLYMGKYEVTQGEWASVYNAPTTTAGLKTLMGNADPSNFPVGGNNGNFPVENVTWWNVIAFCNAKSLAEGFPVAYNTTTGALLDGSGVVTTDTTQVVGYRLPTEAEWEYAAKGGNYTSSCDNTQRCKYSGSNTVNDVTWYNISGSTTHDVGTKSANELGLYDMSGNVWEWMQDMYSGTFYSTSPSNNPFNSSAGFGRTTRSAGWSSNVGFVRSSFRGSSAPSFSNNDLGFRICRTVQ